MGLWGLLVAAVLLLVPAASATAQVQVPAPPQTASRDTEAPLGSPPHWLPNEEWVMQHWLPYDERRLYRLLGIDRGAVWRLLRDDTRNLAQLAESRGWEARALARALVEPWDGRLREPHRLRVLEDRALRTLTQGHLAQHMFFHSLHQDAIPSHAPQIFGVASRAEWSALRRSELSPLQICRLNGLSRGHAQERASETLRSTARRGVDGQAMPAAQGERLLARQERQLPRWLQQTRYNGPPPIVTPRESPATASSYSNNPVIAGNGRRVAFESYEAALRVAKSRGEISIMARGPGAGAPVLASGDRSVPRSSYNPALSGDGRWVVFESADGNLNFAKRYGQMRILAHDLERGFTVSISHPHGLRVARTAYNPTVSRDGSVIAYESYERPDAPQGGTEILVHDRRTGTTRALPGPHGVASDAYEPHLSDDGRHIAFTALVRGETTARSRVFVRDLSKGRTRLASGSEEAWEPELSADGSKVAYTAAGAGGRSRVVIRDLASGRRTVLGAPSGTGLAYEPALSDDGTRVAYVARPSGTRRTQVFWSDTTTGATELVSREDGPGGPPSLGMATHPAISGDGRRVAFTSDAWNLAADKCNNARGVFVRDLERATTRLASVGDGRNRYLGPTQGSSSGADAVVMLMCA